MIFEMISGTPPFRGKDLRDTYKNVLFAEVSFVPAEVFSPVAIDLIKGKNFSYNCSSNLRSDILPHTFCSVLVISFFLLRFFLSLLLLLYIMILSLFVSHNVCRRIIRLAR